MPREVYVLEFKMDPSGAIAGWDDRRAELSDIKGIGVFSHMPNISGTRYVRVLSAREAEELIKEAKAAGVPVYFERFPECQRVLTETQDCIALIRLSDSRYLYLTL